MITSTLAEIITAIAALCTAIAALVTTLNNHSRIKRLEKQMNGHNGSAGDEVQS